MTAALSPVQRLQLACLYTRHHDGYVRQRHLRQIIRCTEPWAVPFVVQLLGEYVLEILNDLAEGLGDLGVPDSDLRRVYGRFVVENPEFFARTERRVVSYYSCYHWWRYADFSTYPPAALLEALRTAAGEHAGAPWPGHAPHARAAKAAAPDTEPDDAGEPSGATVLAWRRSGERSTWASGSSARRHLAVPP